MPSAQFLNFAQFARELQRGPRFAAVDVVSESEAEILADFSSGFSVNYD